MADRIGMALRLAKEGRTEGFQYLYEYTVENSLKGNRPYGGYWAGTVFTDFAGTRDKYQSI